MGSHCNPSIDVENQTDSTILLAQVPPNPDPAVNRADFDDGYALALEPLPTAAAVKTFAAKSQGVVDVANPAGTPPDDPGVDLIGMAAETLFPVSRVELTPTDCGDDKTGKCAGGFDCRFVNPFRADAASATALESAFAYYQLITAFPETKNAKKLVAILKAVLDGTTPPDQLPGLVDAFFKGLDAPYNLCTFRDFSTVISYARSYVPAWAERKASYVYTLYSPNDSESGDTSPAWKKVGTITLTRNRAVTLADRDAGYDIVYVNSANASTNLTLKEGQFVTKTDPDLSTVALAGIFRLKSEYTLDSSDNVILPVLIGKVGTVQVMGVAIDLPTGGKPTPWYDLVNASWARETLAYLGVVAALGGFIAMVYKVGTWIQSKTKKGKTEAQKEKLRKEALESLADALNEVRENQKKAGLSEDVSNLIVFDDDSDSLSKERLNANGKQQGLLLEGRAKQGLKMVEELGKFGIDSELEESTSLLFEARSGSKRIKDYKTMKENQKKVELDLDSSFEFINVDIQSKGTKISKSSRESLEEMGKVQQEIKEVGNRLNEGTDLIIEEKDPQVKFEEK